MKPNKTLFDWLLRFNLYILPLFLLFLSAKAFKEGDVISGNIYTYSYDYSFSDIDQSAMNSYDIFAKKITPLNVDTSFVTSLFTNPYSNSFSSYLVKYDYFYGDFLLYRIPFYNDFLNTYFDNTFYFYFFINEYGDYLFIPDFILSSDSNTLYTFSNELMFDDEEGYLNYYDYTSNSNIDSFSFNSLSNYMFIFYDFGVTGGEFYSNLSTSLDTLFNDNYLSTFNNFITLSNVEVVSISSAELDYPNFNIEFNNIMKPILDLPLASQFYNWFKTNFIQGQNYIIENVWAWIFYMVFVEIALLFKNILVFIFYWCNKFLERGLHNE